MKKEKVYFYCFSQPRLFPFGKKMAERLVKKGKAYKVVKC